METPRPGPEGETGRLVAGRYRLEERIGRGGMATVYRAHDEQLDRAVALKIMRADLGEDPLFVKRFEAEARRAASVSHPNVVPVYDFGTDGAPYIVMGLLTGGDVARAVSAEGRMAFDRAARLAADAAAALQAAHDAGLVHRDVKPGNILIGADGRGRVADFGIARATGEDSMTKTGAVLGSVEYFSPEQARGERAGPASDVYALGVVLYELLTGRRPFHGDSPYAVATARLRESPPDPRRVVPEIPAELAGIVTRAMAGSPADRFASAGAMRSALMGWLERAAPAPEAVSAAATAPGPSRTEVVRSISGPSPRPAASEPPEGRRRSTAIWPVALILLALLVGGYFGGRALFGGADSGSLPGVSAGPPGGEVADLPSSTPVATATPSPSPSPEPTPTEPEVTSTPAATAAPTDAPAPTEPPVAVAGADDAVAAFYGHVAAGRFDEAYALWSARMRQAYPRQENLDGRFADTADISFDTLFVADQSADAATVQANFTETSDSGSTRRFVGYWRLVRVDGRWLLDEPTY